MRLPKLHNQTVFLILAGIFITCLVVADTIGAKLFVIGPFKWIFPGNIIINIPTRLLSLGIIPFIVTFVTTDLINEFFGAKGARTVTFLGLFTSLLAVGFYALSCQIPASPESSISTTVFNQVFGLSQKMFFASLTAYLVGQLLDIQVFALIRHFTKEKALWLRATGSTVVSQLIDSFIVTFFAFYGQLELNKIWELGLNNYGVKFLIALALTPICYIGHWFIHKILKSDFHDKLYN